MNHGLNWQKVILVIPAILFFLIFALGPMVTAIYYGFLKWNGLGPATFIGFQNWIRLFTDSEAIHSLLLTLKMMVVTWVIQTPLSLLLGVFLANKQRYRAIFGIFYFFPLLFSAAAIGLIWSYILNPQFGLTNSLFSSLGLNFMVHNWLGNKHLAFYTVAVVVAWQFVPFHTLLYQAGARGIPETIYEAAELDGARGPKRFFYITLPQLKHTITTSTVLMLTGALTYFDLIYVMTGGGPGDATEILPMYMYKTAFSSREIGYGSVLATVLVIIGVILSLIMLKFTGFNQMESQKEGA